MNIEQLSVKGEFPKIKQGRLEIGGVMFLINRPSIWKNDCVLILNPAVALLVEN